MASEAPWRHDPLLRGFHPEFPDDLQAIVHDGEPRRTGRAPELCWVRVVGVEPAPPRVVMYAPESTPLPREEFERRYAPGAHVYVATLLNQPHGLQSVKQGDALRLLAVVGFEHPLHVTDAYLAERPDWAITPCNKCGASECLDPPTVMAKVRFPDAPAGTDVQAFTAFCVICGGTQMLQRVARGK